MYFTYCASFDATSQIRLLRPISKSQDDSLAFTLEIWNLISPAMNSETNAHNDAPQYIAMSYHWGPEEKSHSVMIDGKQFKIGATCHYALWQACHHQLPGTDESYFWIDQISINQSDVDEKGQQVSMMGDIYRKAYAVYASLGHHADDSQFLCQAINSIDSQTFKDSDTSTQFDLIDRAISEAAPRDTKSCGLAQSLDTFSKRAYFGRLWVIQELWLSANTIILCGQDSMSFDTLGGVWVATFKDDSSMLDYSGGSVDVDSVYPHVPLVVKYIYHYPGLLKEGLSLNSAIRMTEGLGRRDILDTVYALRSMVVWPADLGPVQPDYSITALELFWRVVPYLKGDERDYDSDDDCKFFRRALSMSLKNAERAASRLDYMKRLRRTLGLNEKLKTLAIIKELYPLPEPNSIDEYAHLLLQKDRGWFGQD
jgi:hypothetical protein